MKPTPMLPLPTEEPGTLEERIALAEQRLAAREQLLQVNGQALMQRLRQRTQPRRWLAPVLGGVLLIGVVFWALRRPGRRALPHVAPAAVASAGVSAVGFGNVPWVRAAAALWPLLPAAWRGWVRPGTASLMLAVGLPLVELLFRRRQPRPVR